MTIFFLEWKGIGDIFRISSRNSPHYVPSLFNDPIIIMDLTPLQFTVLSKWNNFFGVFLSPLLPQHFPPYPHPRRLAVVMRRRCNIKELSTFFVFFPRDIFRGVTNSPAGGAEQEQELQGERHSKRRKWIPLFLVAIMPRSYSHSAFCDSCANYLALWTLGFQINVQVGWSWWWSQ